MADMPKFTKLWALIVRWADTQGAENLKALPGLWKGETDEWLVSINGHPREVEGVPAYGYQLTHKTAFVGLAIGNPTGGAVIGPGEEQLIQHFEAQLKGADHD